MSELRGDCARCGTRQVTFDVLASKLQTVLFGWQHVYEAFGVCRHCTKSTIFVLSQADQSFAQIFVGKGPEAVGGAITALVKIERRITLRDNAGVEPPEFLPLDLLAAFKEGATCLAVGCPNAAATMFRLCVDMSTRALLPDGEAEGLNARVRRDLGLRLPWLFENKRLPEALHDLSACIKEDGNDGAHRGTLENADAEDLLDFTVALLERLYTEPKRLEEAAARRAERRMPSPKA